MNLNFATVMTVRSFCTHLKMEQDYWAGIWTDVCEPELELLAAEAEVGDLDTDEAVANPITDSALPFHYVEGMQRVGPGEWTRRWTRHAQRPQARPKKQTRLLDTRNLAGSYKTACCKKLCLTKVTFENFCAMRRRYACKNEHGRCQLILGLLIAGGASRHQRWTVMFQGQRLCRAALLLMLGCSHQKLNKVLAIWRQNGDVVPKRSARLLPNNRLDAACSWLACFFTAVGDLMPDGEIHLPIIIRWTHLHALYYDEVAEGYSYRAFKACVTRWFPKVCPPNLFCCNLLLLEGEVPQIHSAGQMPGMQRHR